MIRRLFSALISFDVVVPRWRDQLQPLHGAYCKSVQSQLEKHLADGHIRPTHLSSKVATRVVGAEQSQSIDPEGLSFININTAEDYPIELLRMLNCQVVLGLD